MEPPLEILFEDNHCIVVAKPAPLLTERVDRATPGARRAVLHYRCLQRGADISLLELHPETGRMHQIRIQAAARGWPVCGDFLYGAKKPFGPPTELPRERIIALHARSL